MGFEIRDASTTIRLSLSNWTPGATLNIRSLAGDEIRILELQAESTSGVSIMTADWENVTNPRTLDNSSMQLQPTILSPLAHITLTLGTGKTTESSYHRFVRTSRIDVIGTGGTAEAAEGVVSVEAGAYTIERFVTEGVSRPGDSEGSTTKYTLKSSRILGANWSILPVPAISIDLANVEKNRSRNSNLLILGAALGVAGGTLIEILLTAAHLGASRPRPTRRRPALMSAQG